MDTPRVTDCKTVEIALGSTVLTKCSADVPYCCNQTHNCCIYNKQHKELWETWYFWFGIILICLFILTSLFSYIVAFIKRKQQNLIRIHNMASPSAPMISTISGPGGIIQPKIEYKKNRIQATAYISNPDVYLEDFAGPLDPPYPPVQPVTIVRGSVPPQGFRQTAHYTELVLPPGYVDAEYHYKHPL